MPIDQTLIGREYYAFRDSTHNLIFIEDTELGVLLRSILDTAEFQRLRHVRQNGLGFLAYPSLETSRFAHSLGSFAVAKKVIEALAEQQPEKGAFGFPMSLRIDREASHGFAIAAALHDIGHGPLSHTWEEISKSLNTLNASFKREEHERVGAKLVSSPDTEIGALFNEYLKKPNTYSGRVIKAALRYLDNTHHLAFLRPLLSGNLDIDRLDFTARDTRAAGVTYGQHDLDWLIRSMRFGRLPQQADDGGELPWVIAIDARKGLNALVQYLRARENMYGLVYLHKTVRAANAHLSAIFLYGAHQLQDGQLEPLGYPILEYLKKGTWPSLGMASVDDTDVWSAIKHLSRIENDPFLKELTHRFLSRKLFKAREISAGTANSLKMLIENGTLATRLRSRLSHFPQLEKLPDPLLCRLLVQVDEIPFDTIGKRKGKQDETWIMYRRAIDLGLTPLREYWREVVESETSKTFRFVHYFPGIQNDILELVATLESAFPRGSEKAKVTPSEDKPAETKEFPVAPEGFTINRLLSEAGKHKIAYIGLYSKTSGGSFTNGEAYVLKRFREISKQDAQVLRESLGRIFKVQSDYLTRSDVLTASDNAHWLVENLWVSDLLQVVQTGGIRRDIVFLLSMARDLFHGLSEIAHKNIRHGDIKLENCGVIDLGGGKLRFQVGDFGSATANPEKVPSGDSGLGTLKARPPELLTLSTELRKVGLPSDVWSLAATIFAAATGAYPFMPLVYDRSARSVKADEISKDLQSKMEVLQRSIENEIPPVLGEILGPCLTKSFDERPTAEEITAKLNKALVECGDAGHEKVSLLWQRTLDLHQLAESSKNDEALLKNIRSEFDEISKLDPKWIAKSLHHNLSNFAP